MRSCVLVALALVAAGCATPTERLMRIAAAAGLARTVISGEEFDHVAFTRAPLALDRPIRVYIEGDGRPWRTPTEVDDDPTPRDPLALRLMQRDPAPSIWLGRPCYLGEARNCTPRMWTSARYSERVVVSMASALRRLLPSADARVILIGHSGGGTLALLLADRFAHVDAVVTVAGNLDVAGWAAHHGYTPLVESRDPMRRPGGAVRYREIHLVGARDEVVPPRLAHGYARMHAGARVVTVQGYDHRCCWEQVWPRMLEEALAPEPASAKRGKKSTL